MAGTTYDGYRNYININSKLIGSYNYEQMNYPERNSDGTPSEEFIYRITSTHYLSMPVDSHVIYKEDINKWWRVDSEASTIETVTNENISVNFKLSFLPPDSPEDSYNGKIIIRRADDKGNVPNDLLNSNIYTIQKK